MASAISIVGDGLGHLERLETSVLIHDRNLRVRAANQAACRLSGRSRQELEALSLTDLSPEHYRPHFEVMRSRFERVLGGASDHVIWLSQAAQGQTHALEVSLHPVDYQGERCILAMGRPLNSCGLPWLRESSALLMESLLGELSDSLTPVMLGSDILSSNHDGDGRAVADTMARAASRAQDLARQLQRLLQGTTEKPEPAELSAVVRSVAGVLRLHARRDGVQLTARPGARVAYVELSDVELMQLLIEVYFAFLSGMGQRAQLVIEVQVPRRRPTASADGSLPRLEAVLKVVCTGDAPAEQTADIINDAAVHRSVVEFLVRQADGRLEGNWTGARREMMLRLPMRTKAGRRPAESAAEVGSV